VKMTCISKHNLARSARKNLFAQPLSKHYLARSAMKILLIRALFVVGINTKKPEKFAKMNVY